MDWASGSDDAPSGSTDVPLGIQAMMGGMGAGSEGAMGAGSASSAQAMMVQQSTVRNQQAMMQTAKMFSQAASMVQAAGMAKMLKQIAEWEWAEENDGKKAAKQKQEEEQAPTGFDPEALQKYIQQAKDREEEEARAEEEAADRRRYEEEQAAARRKAEIAMSIKKKMEEEDELVKLRKRAEEAEARLQRLEATKSGPPAWSPPAAFASAHTPHTVAPPQQGKKVMTSDEIHEQVQALAEGFEVEEDASLELVRVFLDRALRGCDLQVDLAMFSEHLATSNKPSELVSFMTKDLRQGTVIHPCQQYRMRMASGNYRPGDEIARRFHQGLPAESGGPSADGPLSSDMAFNAAQIAKEESTRGVGQEIPPPIEKSGDKGTDDALLSIRKTADEVAARIAMSLQHDRMSAAAAAAAGGGPGGSKAAEFEAAQAARAAEKEKEMAFMQKNQIRPRSISRPRAPSPRKDDRDRSYNDRRYDKNRDRGDGFYDRRGPSRDRGRYSRSRSRNRSRSRGKSRSKSGNRGLPKTSNIPLAPAEQGQGEGETRASRRKRESKWDSMDTPPQPAYKPSAMPKALPSSSNYKVLRLQALQIRSLLGKGGETINSIRIRSGADIKIHHPPHEPEGTVSIVGNAAFCETLIAQALIMRGCPMASNPGVTEDWDDIPIPPHLVGLFLGTKGAQIKELQKMVGDSVGISVQPPKEPGGMQSIRIVGEHRDHAKQIIQLKVDSIIKGHAQMTGQVPAGKGFAGVTPGGQSWGGGKGSWGGGGKKGQGDDGYNSSMSTMGAISL